VAISNFMLLLFKALKRDGISAFTADKLCSVFTLVDEAEKTRRLEWRANPQQGFCTYQNWKGEFVGFLMGLTIQSSSTNQHRNHPKLRKFHPEVFSPPKTRITRRTTINCCLVTVFIFELVFQGLVCQWIDAVCCGKIPSWRKDGGNFHRPVVVESYRCWLKGGTNIETSTL